MSGNKTTARKASQKYGEQQSAKKETERGEHGDSRKFLVVTRCQGKGGVQREGIGKRKISSGFFPADGGNPEDSAEVGPFVAKKNQDVAQRIGRQQQN